MKKRILWVSFLPYFYVIIISVIYFFNGSFHSYFASLGYFLSDLLENYWFTFFPCFIYQVFCLCAFLNCDDNRFKKKIHKTLLLLSIIFLGFLLLYFILAFVKAFFFGTSGFLCMDWGDCRVVYGLKAISYTIPFILVIVVELTVIPVLPFTISYVICYKNLNRKKKIRSR